MIFAYCQVWVVPNGIHVCVHIIRIKSTMGNNYICVVPPVGNNFWISLLRFYGHFPLCLNSFKNFHNLLLLSAYQTCELPCMRVCFILCWNMLVFGSCSLPKYESSHEFQKKKKKAAAATKWRNRKETETAAPSAAYPPASHSTYQQASSSVSLAWA